VRNSCSRVGWCRARESCFFQPCLLQTLHMRETLWAGQYGRIAQIGLQREGCCGLSLGILLFALVVAHVERPGNVTVDKAYSNWLQETHPESAAIHETFNRRAGQLAEASFGRELLSCVPYWTLTRRSECQQNRRLIILSLRVLSRRSLQTSSPHTSRYPGLLQTQWSACSSRPSKTSATS
jgi:hypothetical protein